LHSSDAIRTLLTRLAGERNVGLQAVSRAIGKNHAYLQQFVTGRRSPAVLPEAVRIALGRYFRVDPDLFKPPEHPADQQSMRSIDADLLARANYVARYVIGGDPADEPIRVSISAAVYTLLERGKMDDDEGTLEVLALLARRLRGPAKPPGETG